LGLDILDSFTTLFDSNKEIQDSLHSYLEYWFAE